MRRGRRVVEPAPLGPEQLRGLLDAEATALMNLLAKSRDEAATTRLLNELARVSGRMRELEQRYGERQAAATEKG